MSIGCFNDGHLDLLNRKANGLPMSAEYREPSREETPLEQTSPIKEAEEAFVQTETQLIGEQ